MSRIPIATRVKTPTRIGNCYAHGMGKKRMIEVHIESEVISNEYDSRG